MSRIACLLLCSGMTLLLSSPVLAQQQPGPGYSHHMWNDGWHGWFFGPIMMVMLIAVAIVVVVLLVRWLGGSNNAGPHHQLQTRTPLDILKERFAKGEIEKEEFEERRRILDG